MYLARVGVGQSRVPMSVQMATRVTPGLSSECSPDLSTRVSFTVSFCAEEWSCDDDHADVTTAATNDDDDDYEDCDDTEADCDIWAEADNQDDCPGEWGCVGTDHEDETEMTTELADTDDNDVVDVIYSTLMSETMTPVTITVLLILGMLLLLAMWCLTCRGRHCCSCHHCNRY